LKCFCEDIPATSTANLSAINRNTVQRIFTLLRDKIVDMAIAESKPFVGDIEVDESYFGPRRVRGKRERGASGKIPVLGLNKRQGRVFLSVVKNCSKAELMPILQGRIVEGSDVYTDSWKAYDELLTNGHKHHRVHHHENEFARGKNHVKAPNHFGAIRSFAWQNFAESGRRNSLFISKNRSGVSIIELIRSTQYC
jgi:transposase-like protein